MSGSTNHGHTDAIIEQLGLTAEREGMPRISGQIWGLLLATETPLNGKQIAEKLAVSRGSISTATRMLESLGVLERRVRPGDRQTYYAMREHPYSNLARLSAERARTNSLKIRKLRDGEANTETRQRLENLMHFYANTAHALQKCADDLAAFAISENRD